MEELARDGEEATSKVGSKQESMVSWKPNEDHVLVGRVINSVKGCWSIMGNVNVKWTPGFSNMEVI